MFEGHNKESIRTVKEGINTEGMEFVKLADYIGKTIKVDGFFFTKSKYGEQAVVVADGKLINVPKRYTDDFKEIRDNKEELAAVLEGKLSLGNIKEIDSKNGKTVIFDFIG